MSAGRPRRYPTAELLQEAVDQYFYDLHASKKNPTITGLVYHLGFASRKEIERQKAHGDDYDEVLSRARLRVEMIYEERLMSREVVGAIFALKNLGWTDKQEQILTVVPGDVEKMSDEELETRLHELQEKRRLIESPA